MDDPQQPKPQLLRPLAPWGQRVVFGIASWILAAMFLGVVLSFSGSVLVLCWVCLRGVWRML